MYGIKLNTLKRTYTSVGIVLTENGGEHCTHQITARSEKHAMRIARALGWAGFSGGVGQQFGRLEYLPSVHRLVYRLAFDI